MIVAVLHGQVPADASRDEQDVMVQVEVVSQALSQLGYTPVAVPLSLELETAVLYLRRLRPLFVFNLVETVQGRGHYIHLGPALLDDLQVPYTGAQTAAMVATSNKLLTKKILASADLPTPPWQSMEGVLREEVAFAGPYIIKSVWEYGSIGLDDAAVVADRALLKPTLERRSHEPAAPWFVERYIPGREFNLSLLAGRGGPELLPPAEIVFTEYPAEKIRLVGYRAKWD
jgi:D-alanine-D-alanine ligase